MSAQFGYIYGLYDYLDNLRYIGKTIGIPHKRLACHLYDAKRGRNTYCAKWIRSLLHKNTLPKMKIFEICEVKLTEEREVNYIAHFRNLGVNLTNLTNGGDGTNGYTISEETRDKRRLRMMGNSISKGYKHSKATKAKVSAASRGRKLSPEAKSKIAASNRRRKLSIATRAKIGAAHRGKTLKFARSEEYKTKMSLLKIQWWAERKTSSNGNNNLGWDDGLQ